MIRIALTILLLAGSVQAGQAAFFWEGLSPFMDKAYCLRHYSAERCALIARTGGAHVVRETPPTRPAEQAPERPRPVPQK